MKYLFVRTLMLTTGLLAAGAIAQTVALDGYPARPVRIIVPFAPGGPADIVARLLAQKLGEDLGKQFFVENQPGAGGNLGMGAAARAVPDGYTILVTPPSYVINPALYDKTPYDARKSFDPVTLAVVDRAVGERAGIEIAAQFAVDAMEHIEIEARRDARGIVIGVIKHTLILLQIDADHHPRAFPQDAPGAA